MRTNRVNFAMALAGMNFTRDAAGTQQLPEFNKEALTRSFIFERASVDEDKRTVELSFSSEVEVERWFGYEVLDHSAGAMRMDRIIGGSLLINHDWDDQVGVVESVRVDADKKGRAVVRFGRSPRAEEIFQDVKDSIRKQVSVGYRVLGAKLKETREDGDVYLITDWEPYEISLVSVPADITVGVGRSGEKLNNEKPPVNAENEPKAATPAKQQRALNMKFEYFTDANGNYCRQQVNENGERFGQIEIVRAADDTAQRGAENERKRVAELMQLGERFGASDLVRQYIDENKTPAELQTAILERQHSNQGKPVTEKPKAQNANIGMTGDEVRRFSLMRAVRAMLPGATQADIEAASFERECSEAAAKAYGRSAQGIMVPADVLSRAFEIGGNTSGATLVGTDHRADMFIDLLRKRTTLLQLGYMMNGLVGDVDIPKQTGGATAYWVGEGEAATGSQPSVGQRKLSPHTVAAYTDITRKLLQQGTPDAENLVWNDLNKAIALEIDRAGYYGTGLNNQPTGLKNISGINAVNFAATNPTFAELVSMETAVAADNAEVDRMAYVINATTRGTLKTTPKFGSGTEATIWEQGNTVNGYRTEVTNQIAAGDVFFGNFADLIIGLWGGLDITVDPYALSTSGGLRIVAFQDVDFVLRNNESICYGVKPAI